MAVSNVVISEADGSTQITASLSAPAPTDTVLSLAYSSPGEAGPDDYLAAGTITIFSGQTSAEILLQAIDDELLEQDESLVIEVDSVSNGLVVMSQPLSVVIEDNDQGGFSVNVPSQSFEVSESGSSASISVVLTHAPRMNVQVDVSVSDPSEGVLSSGLLEFTPGDWNVPQIVTVTGVADLLEDGDAAFGVTVEVDESKSDQGYFGLESKTVELVNTNVSVTRIGIEDKGGILVVRNLDSDRLILQEDDLAKIHLDLEGESKTVDIGLFGDFAGIVAITHQNDDAINYGEDWKLEQPSFVEGRFTHILQRDEATVHVVNDVPHVNPVNPLDTNRDGKVTSLDALVGVNKMNRTGPGLLDVPVPEGEPQRFYYDVNQDGSITAIDSLRVINYLARNIGFAEATSVGLESREDVLGVLLSPETVAGDDFPENLSTSLVHTTATAFYAPYIVNPASSVSNEDDNEQAIDAAIEQLFG